MTANPSAAPNMTEEGEHVLNVQMKGSAVLIRFKGNVTAVNSLYPKGTKLIVWLDGNRWVSEEEALALADQEGRKKHEKV